MKFGKLLKSTTQEMPEMGNLFLRYKALKKQLKRIAGQQCHTPTSTTSQQDEVPVVPQNQSDIHAQEAEFLRTLNEDLSRFNQFYIEKEEDCVIKMQSLTDQIHSTRNAGDLQVLKAELVELHGEMVLLLHWSLLNYAAVMKILKKHDKCTGADLKSPFQPLVLQQPFSSTSIMSRLVKEAEALIQKLVMPVATTALLSSSTDGGAGAGGCSISTQQARPAVTSELPGAEANNSAGGCSTGGPPGAAAAAAGDGVAQGGVELDEQQQDGVGGQSEGHSSDDANQPFCKPALGLLLRRTQSALEMWQQMSQTASTPSTVVPAQKLTELRSIVDARASLKRPAASSELQVGEGEQQRPSKRPCSLEQAAVEGETTAVC